MSFIQWTEQEGKFFPVGKTQPALPSGCYKICESMQGLYLEKQDLRQIDLLDLPDDNASKVVREINRFWELKDKFAEHKMPYKRGILLYGAPGTGKTCCLRSAMENLMKRDGIIIEFSYPDAFLEGYKIVRQIHPNKSVIALMEDLDSIISNCSESKLLNILDGAHDVNNIIFVATTNYPERLGSRIFNRPSRFDKKFFIGMPKPEARRMYLEWKGIKDPDLSRWVEDTDEMTISHLAELYTAVRVFEESYEEALDVIKSMELIPHSSLFDKSAIADSPEMIKSCYYEAKKKLHGKKKVITEDSWDIDQIAKMI